ncbi:MAG: hypothetical protein Q4C96_10260 [Planctomycetia bacterium]|nr:hypothetical protein [Planctomycetia bacterium]
MFQIFVPTIFLCLITENIFCAPTEEMSPFKVRQATNHMLRLKYLHKLHSENGNSLTDFPQPYVSAYGNTQKHSSENFRSDPPVPSFHGFQNVTMPPMEEFQNTGSENTFSENQGDFQKTHESKITEENTGNVSHQESTNTEIIPSTEVTKTSETYHLPKSLPPPDLPPTLPVYSEQIPVTVNPPASTKTALPHTGIQPAYLEMNASDAKAIIPASGTEDTEKIKTVKTTENKTLTETTVPEEKSPKHSWAALTTTIFLLLLSLAGNIFLAWQFWDQRKILEELLKK